VKENNDALKTILPNVINGQSPLNRVLEKPDDVELLKKFYTL